MDIQVIDDCLSGALGGTVTFPQTIQRLIPVGVERYLADMVRMEKVYYSKDGNTHIQRMPVPGMPGLGQEFNQPLVADAITSIQQSLIDYPEFLKRIVKAGCASYVVFLDGRQAVYYGRKGEEHVEKFPDPKR